MKLLSDKEIEEHWPIRGADGQYKVMGLLLAQAKLTAKEKDAEWRIALEIAHQQDEEHWHDIYKEKLREIFREIEKYLLTYSGSIVIKKEQWKVLEERFGVK